MAQISLHRAWRRNDALPPDNAMPVAGGGRAEEPPRANRWLARYAGLIIGAVVAMGMVGLCAFSSELEAVRWKLARATEIERAQAMEYVRQINAAVNPATVSEVVSSHHLVTKPSAVVAVDLDVSLPPIEATPVISPQPFRVATGPKGSAVAGAYKASVAGRPQWPR